MEDSPTPITNLPTELLECILLQVVQTRVDDHHGYEQVFRCRQLEAVRLVCRRFYKSSWKAFARVAETTAFDLRSKASMRALEAISLHPRICPLVRSLGFAFYQSVKTEVRNEGECSQEELDAMKMVDARWYPKVCSLARVSHMATEPLPLETQQQVAEAAGLILLVARSLRKFGSLEEVRYYKRFFRSTYAIPPRYNGIATKYRAVFDSASVYTDYTAQLVLEILLRALAESGQSPIRLELAITSNQLHAFVCETPLSLMKQVMRKVEKLGLKDSFIAGTYLPTGKRPNQMALSKLTLPSLRHLTVDTTSYTSTRDHKPLPHIDQIPELESLTACLKCDDPETQLEFVSRYAAKARRLKLKQHTGPWVQLLPRLASLHLEMLELAFNEDAEWEIEHEAFVDMLAGVNAEMVGKSALEVIITPIDFRERIFAHFESPEEPPESSFSYASNGWEESESEVASAIGAEIDLASESDGATNESDEATDSSEEEGPVRYVFGPVTSRNRDRTMPAAFVWS